jgi:hypothetical protein
MSDPARINDARAEAEAFLSGMDQQSPPEVPLEVIEGAQDSLGVPLWVLIQRQELGVWSKAEELPGRFIVTRLLEKNDDPQPQRALFKVEIASFPYVDDPASLDSAALNASYEFIDPSWEALIPGSWRYYKPKSVEEAP